MIGVIFSLGEIPLLTGDTKKTTMTNDCIKIEQTFRLKNYFASNL